MESHDSHLNSTEEKKNLIQAPQIEVGDSQVSYMISHYSKFFTYVFIFNTSEEQRIDEILE